MAGPGDLTPIATARRNLGRQLAAARKAAGYTQEELARVVGYSRSTVSNAEIGHPDVARAFWAGCDRVLKNGRAFSVAFDQIRAAGRRQAAGLPAQVPGSAQEVFRRVRVLITSADLAGALAGYRELGWHARACEGGTLQLLTGGALDALEVPPAAAALATSLWQHSQGRADAVLGLPGLPRPAHALAVIRAGNRCYFLAAAGGCPWSREDAPARPAEAAIRWHADGSLVPLPPSPLPTGERAAWVHLPSGRLCPPPAIALLWLLGVAVATAPPGQPVLTLPGGVRVTAAPPAPAGGSAG